MELQFEILLRPACSSAAWDTVAAPSAELAALYYSFVAAVVDMVAVVGELLRWDKGVLVVERGRPLCKSLLAVVVVVVAGGMRLTIAVGEMVFLRSRSAFPLVEVHLRVGLGGVGLDLGRGCRLVVLCFRSAT